MSAVRGKPVGKRKKDYKRCIKCREWKPRRDLVEEVPVEDEDGEVVGYRTEELQAGFGSHNSSDGLQSICHQCKNKANKVNRDRNPTARLRHHIATRCYTQLGHLAPEGLSKNLESCLGYKIRALVKHLRADLKARGGIKASWDPEVRITSLRDALNDGAHVDHIKPLSLFKVIKGGDDGWIDWDEFQRCWAPENLRVESAEDNLKKGARYDDENTTTV